MNLAEQGMAAYLGEERLRYLQTVAVGVAGCGGLGSNCAMHLARSGFKRFVLADFDRVDPSNLNRQAFTFDQLGLLKVRALAANMLAVNPDLQLDLQAVEVTPDNMTTLFAHCDAVVEAFDGADAKKALVETFMQSDTFLVTASGIGGFGDADSIVTRRVRDRLVMVGDMETECTADNPPLSPKVGVAAAKQADAVLHHYLSKFDRRSVVHAVEGREQ